MANTADTIIDSMLTLLGEHRFEDVTLQAIANGAGVSLAELRRHFSTRGEILEAFASRIDNQVLEGDYADMADEAPRDRLFDVLMARLDALVPHKPAERALLAAAKRDPALALFLNTVALRSHTWMLAAAGLSAPGWRGRVAVQSLAVAFVRVLQTFLSEDDPGMPRTMAKLDKELRNLETTHGRLSRLFGQALRPQIEPHDAASAFAGSDSDAATLNEAEPEDAAAAPHDPPPAQSMPPDEGVTDEPKNDHGAGVSP